MGGQSGNAQGLQGAAATGASQSGTNAQGFGAQQQGLFSTLYGTPGGNATSGGGTLSGMLNPNSLNVNSPTGPYALQYAQAKAQNAIGTDQASQAINQRAQNAGFGAGAPSGLTQFLQSQNTQAGNTNAGNLFSQYAGQSYQDALNNFWKATNLASGQAATSGNQQNTAQGQMNQTYAQLYGAAPKQSGVLQAVETGLNAPGGFSSTAGGTLGKKV